MKNKIVRVLLLVLVGGGMLWGVVGCDGEEVAGDGQEAMLVFSLRLNPEVYQKSYFKKPPQFAIWIEGPDGKTIRTVFVTHGTGKGDWGRADIVRPVSLPYWVTRWNLETLSSGEPTADDPAVDAITMPTPNAEHTTRIKVPAGSVWNYFVEVNVSGDYNEAFAASGQDGKKDAHGNGQPSIVYKGEITSLSGQKSIPELIGRTDQFQNIKHLVGDMDGITTAKDLLLAIKVSCEEVEG